MTQRYNFLVTKRFVGEGIAKYCHLELETKK